MNETWADVGRSFALVPRRRLSMVEMSVASLGGIGVFIAIPLLMDRVFTLAIGHVHIARIAVAVAAYAAVSLIGAIANRARMFVVQRTTEDATYALRAMVLARVQALPLSVYVHAPTGALVSRTLNDTARAAAGSIVGGTNLLNQLLQAAAGVAILAVLDVRLAGVALLLAPLLLLPSRSATPRLRRASDASVDQSTRTARFLGDRLNVEACLLTRESRRQAEDNEEAKARFGAQRDQNVARYWLQARLGGVTDMSAELVTVGVLALGSVLVALHQASPGVLVAFAVTITQLLGPLGQVATSVALTQDAVSAWSRLLPLLEQVPAELPAPGGRTGDDRPRPMPTHMSSVSVPPPSVTLEHVSFRYAPSDTAAALLALPDNEGSPSEPLGHKSSLTDISFEVAGGHLAAIVGPSGSGKTTIAHLIVGVIRPDAGTVRIGGTPVWRDDDVAFPSGAKAALVPQTPFFHNDTVAANLRYAAPTATLTDLERACASAQILDRIRSLPEGFDSSLGESGWMFSGGERQRLAIARALLHDAGVLVCDEPSAHLDHTSLELISQVLEGLRGHRTVVVVTHRLDDFGGFDQVIHIEGGRVVHRATDSPRERLPSAGS